MSIYSHDDGTIRSEIAHPTGATIVMRRDLADLSAHAADLFVTLARRAAEAEGNRFTVALSGGNTPRHLYALLTAAPYAAQIPWERVHVFWGDERHVPPDDAASNYRMAHEAFLSRVPIPEQNVHRIRAELPAAAEVARAYEADLHSFFHLRPGELPRFDLVLLGLGPDGHTASLFPGSAALHDTEHLVAAPWVARFNTHRITLTPMVLNNAATVVFLVSGTDKAATLHDVLDGPRAPDQLPAQLIAPATGTLLWIVDQAAAAQL
jgi:6-phosphogluconolactonase